MEYIKEHYAAEWQTDGWVKITAAKEGSHRVFWSAGPEGFSDDNELEAFKTTTIVPNPLGWRRCYYHIISGDGYSVTTPRNLIPDGISNLRDLGGYNTADMSCFLKYGVLYRSGSLFYKEPQKKAFVESLSLRQVVDLRIPEEAAGKYADPVIPGADYINVSPMKKTDMKQVINSMNDLAELNAEQAAAAYRDVFNAYSTMIFGSEAYQTMFRLLIDGKLPLLYHCSAGKDRTGVATALILMAVGIPRETIIYDYMLTNQVRAEFINRYMAAFKERCGDNEEILESLGFFIKVSLEAIQSTFDAIDGKYSDINVFFEKELLVTQSDIEKLKSMLLVEHKLGKIRADKPNRG